MCSFQRKIFYFLSLQTRSEIYYGIYLYFLFVKKKFDYVKLIPVPFFNLCWSNNVNHHNPLLEVSSRQ